MLWNVLRSTEVLETDGGTDALGRLASVPSFRAPVRQLPLILDDSEKHSYNYLKSLILSYILESKACQSGGKRKRYEKKQSIS